jgi:hypothetical protein
LGNWIAYGAIALFLALLAALFIRTALMVGSVFCLAWTRRGEAKETTNEGGTKLETTNEEGDNSRGSSHT